MGRISTGVTGLDEILGGGLPGNHVYLLQGPPGSGKTTISIQFLLEGVRHGEKNLYITLLQARRELDETFASHGWSLAGIEIVSLLGAAEAESRLSEQTLLPSSEVQLDDVVNGIREAIDRVKPARLVFDSIDQLRLLANDPALYRRKVLMILRMLEDRSITALFTEPTARNEEFKTLCHGVIMLDMVMPRYGEMRRRLWVEKVRGAAFAGGYHSLRIRTGGVVVYPRLPLRESAIRHEWLAAHSGNEELDALLGGGLEFGTACLIAGQTGTGKSTMASEYACAAAKRGEHAVVYLFDERLDTFVRRSEGLGTDVVPLMDKGMLAVKEVSVGELSAGQLADLLRTAVEDMQARVVVIDSISGYFASLPEEPQLAAQLHEMLAYLSQHNVLSLITLAEHNPRAGGPVFINASYIADSVVQLRRFEAFGRVRIAISVIKKRHGNHEKTIRELQITENGLVLGEPLDEFQGVLTGEPVFVGKRNKLME